MPHFIFCVHNHQPVGNFGHVIEESYTKAYLPFLKAVSRYPSIKLCLHITGYLLDWIEENHGEYIEMLRGMVRSGQVEIMGGAYYEPILAVIPPPDRLGQLRMMSDRLEKLFGKRPRGMWLAERIWEPQLPGFLKDAGIEYVVVDDYHFVKAGLKKEQMAGYYITEDLGESIKVFPGSERLRYIIPFETADKFVENLMWVSTLGSNPVAIFADDGEKFGTWPGTHQWVYKEGWLSKFLETISQNKSLIRPITFSEYLDSHEPLGRVYLPTTSYMEMGEWALPAQASQDFTNLVNEVKTWQDGDKIRRFLQGGFWRNFFAKYPEANWMHKRMLMVSEEVSEIQSVKESEKNRLKSQTLNFKSHLYQAQCNDAYWHGVFGGLYLPHLRTAVYNNLIQAENLLEEKSGKKLIKGQESYEGHMFEEKDFDADTKEEIFVKTPFLNLFFNPHKGGALTELDFRPTATNLSNTLSRWEEGYHYKVRMKSEQGSGDQARSIHDLTGSKEDGLDKYLFFDRYQRVSLLDHFFKKEETLDALRKSVQEEIGDFYKGNYVKKSLEALADESRAKRFKKGASGGQGQENGIQLILKREGKVKGRAITIEKGVLIQGNTIDVNYRINPTSSTQDGGGVNSSEARFGIEFNFLLPCCDGPDGFYDVPGVDIKDQGLGSIGELTGVRQLSLVDQWTKIKVNFILNKAASVWRFPVETVSISEAGFEKVFQGSCVVLLWDISLDGPFETGFRVSVESIKT